MPQLVARNPYEYYQRPGWKVLCTIGEADIERASWTYDPMCRVMDVYKDIAKNRMGIMPHTLVKDVRWNVWVFYIEDEESPS